VPTRSASHRGWGRRMSDVDPPTRGNSKVAVKIAVISAVGTVVAAIITGGFLFAGNRGSAQPSSSPPTQPTSPQAFRIVDLTCKAPTQARRGQTISVTYKIQSVGEGDIGLGAGIYINDSEDLSDGNGDEDSTHVPAGVSDRSRTVHIPASLASGSYELTVELWQPNSIGVGETIKDASCGHVKVTR